MSAIPETIVYRVGVLERRQESNIGHVQEVEKLQIAQGKDIGDLREKVTELTRAVNRMTGALILACLTITGSCIGIVLTVAGH